MKYKSETFENLKREVLIKGAYLSLYIRICIVTIPNIVQLFRYLKDESKFYKPLYKNQNEDPYVIARQYLGM